MQKLNMKDLMKTNLNPSMISLSKITEMAEVWLSKPIKFRCLLLIWILFGGRLWSRGRALIRRSQVWFLKDYV